MLPPAGYRIRPSRPLDLDAVGGLYVSCFAHDAIVDLLFPTHRDCPRDFRVHMYRHYQRRLWTPGWVLTVLVDEARGGLPVGFAWWRRPEGDLTLAERWFTSYAWLAPLKRLYVSFKDCLWPTAVLATNASILGRILATVELQLLEVSPPRHLAAAWFLSSFAVLPELQGRGLGAALLCHGLRRVDRNSAPSWLVGIGGVDYFYARHGFVEVARANVEELAGWEGGTVMFRHSKSHVSPA
ncbi:acetyltransferase (GNAT) domain-containing protein [Hirsutella rhossiliensis]|uniref:Acetyltransferase (GNAT) domain-containing protein n=1 Tax=Hirsutella rhossiliensis TaxID=111463 RepID=A0A9P8N6Q3_9HYPO|nr:acetyltransferase (GNAT) domain-containing protein [Hirsutella rhossiliensis]KAH0968638.1 acetyltransferase (GNAT) domain-containing protein [Hirsutella rhossiliensis]